MYQSFPQEFYREQGDAMPIAKTPSHLHKEVPHEALNTGSFLKVFDNLNLDDIIIIGLIILLLTEGNEEWLLIGLLGFILIQ